MIKSQPAADRYTRHFWRFADEFPEVYEDDVAYAAWGRLLRLADMAWPAAATLPFGVKRQALAVLTKDREGGPLVVMVTAATFRVRGMDKHRAKRSQSAKDAADARWGNADSTADGYAERIADSNAETMPSREEEIREEERRREQSAPASDDPVVAFHERTGEFPSGKLLSWINDLGSRHGEERVARLIRETPMTTTSDPPGYLRSVMNRLRLEDRAAERAERDDEKRRNAEKREPVSPVVEELRRHLRAQEATAI